MKKYEVNYTDRTTGATSAIDTIAAPNNYTAADYIRECEENGDPDYVEMLHDGIITLVKID